MSRQVLSVGPDSRDRYRTIGEALAAARTGALISVRPGTYAENLVIHTRVTLTAAEGRGTVEIRPRSGSVIALRADAVMLSELTLRGGDAELPAVDVRRGRPRSTAARSSARPGPRCWPEGRAPSHCATAG